VEVEVQKEHGIWIVTINRPEVRNAINGPTARMLYGVFTEFDADQDARVSILCGAGGTFCSGADLKAFVSGDPEQVNPLNEDLSDVAPLGPTRLTLSKPVIAAISGYAVGGGLELALWCDLRIAEEDSVFGFFERRFGVPLIDGGTYRLPKIVGLGRALEIILEGREIHAEEAQVIGLVNRVVPKGKALEEARKIAFKISSFPRVCLEGDRRSVYAGMDLDLRSALELEFKNGMETLSSGEAFNGAIKFAEGKGRHGVQAAD